MFNYQSGLYAKVGDTWQCLNVSKAILSKNIDWASGKSELAANIVYHMLPPSVRESRLLVDIYSDWRRCYDGSYKWIQPKLSVISNTTLHYSTGVSIGVVASVLLLFFVLAKFLPSRLKSIGYLLMLFGTSASLWVLTSVSNYFTEPVTDTFVQYWQYFVGYVLIVGVLSFALVYRYGPVTDERTLSLIQWFLQLVGLVLVYNSTQIREVSIALIIVLLTLYNFPRRIFLNERTKNIWYRFFPPKIKLLTDDEYMVQGNLETKRELDKLREYCRSPDCQAWKVISKLNSPHRFAEFVEGNSWHVNNEELLEYDSGPDPTPPHLISDEDEEEEMDFILSSP